MRIFVTPIIRNHKMRRIILLILTFTFAFVSIQSKAKFNSKKDYVYRFYLKDKKGGSCSIDRPKRFLSQKSIERRKRQGLRIDSTDLPVPMHLVSLFETKETHVLGTSRWNNTVLVCARDTTSLSKLRHLPCVREACMVYQFPDSIKEDGKLLRPKHHEKFNRWDSLRNDPLGMARTQIEMVKGDRLHENDLCGQGITIAVLDGGFQNVDRLPCFSQTNIIGTYDFVGQAQGLDKIDFFKGIDHGTKVLSVMGAMAPEVMTGTAPEANYWLLRCEDPDTEMPIEEDFWAMASEFADSVGVDIINSSLGYQEFDNDLGNYQLKDLDGHSTLISHTASLLADKGIILCCSAGNSGMGSWKKITIPADAIDVLTVGAVNQHGNNAPFASVGPTQDGRVKPDVVALGSGTTLISGRGTLIRDMGTSFSTPIICGLVACLWQGLPKKNAREIMELVRQSSSQFDTPDNIYGYGLPNFWQAFMIGKASDSQ